MVFPSGLSEYWCEVGFNYRVVSKGPDDIPQRTTGHDRVKGPAGNQGERFDAFPFEHISCTLMEDLGFAYRVTMTFAVWGFKKNGLADRDVL